jgi:hypothetical protein
MIGDNAAAIFGEGAGWMRRLAAAVAISAAAFGLAARATDESSSSVAAPAPLDEAMLAMMTGGTAAASELGANAEAGAQSLDPTATSVLQASNSHSSSHLAGAARSGEITLGEASGAMGGVNSVQLSTGVGNIQQNSMALAFAF